MNLWYSFSSESTSNISYRIVLHCQTSCPPKDVYTISRSIYTSLKILWHFFRRSVTSVATVTQLPFMTTSNSSSNSTTSSMACHTRLALTSSDAQWPRFQSMDNIYGFLRYPGSSIELVDSPHWLWPCSSILFGVSAVVSLSPLLILLVAPFPSQCAMNSNASLVRGWIPFPGRYVRQ